MQEHKYEERSASAAEQKRLALARRLLQIAAEERWAAGHRLLESHLAEQLKVSRSPIRALLRFLADEGIVTLEAGRGARFNLSADRLDQVRLANVETASEQLYEAIIRARLAGQLGESFTLAEVMRSLGSARAPAEAVLLQLANEGIVAKRQGQGWTFVPALDSAQAQRESYEFRKLLEPGAIRSPFFSMSPERCQALQHSHHELIEKMRQGTADAGYIYAVDIGFHRAIASCSGNSFIEDALERQNKLRRLQEYGSYDDQARVVAWAMEHLDILSAIERNRLEVAATLMLDHIRCAERETPVLS